MISFKKISTRTKFVALSLALSQSFALTPWPVLAAGGEIRVAGQDVFSITGAAGGMTASERADAVQRNLDNALVATKDRSPSAVNIVYVKGMPVITLGGFQVVTVDSASARASATTPALLAKRWADGLRQSLTDSASVESYVAQLSGDYGQSAPPVNSSGPSYNQVGNVGAPGATSANYSNYRQTSPPPQYRGRVAYAPAGLTIPVVLRTSISTQAARPGDMIEAQISESVQLGEASIPAGSTVVGQITNATEGKFLGRSGELGLKFTRLRTPDGVETPITAHIVGSVGKYAQIGTDQSGVVKGETWKNKAGQVALRGAIGAGTGAAVGTAIGAIAGRSGKSVGRGAWSGAAIGSGLGAAQSLILRKGRDVTIASGQILQLQLDAPATIAGAGVPPYAGAF